MYLLLFASLAYQLFAALYLRQFNLSVFLFPLHSCFARSVCGTEWHFMWWCIIKKLLAHSVAWHL